MSIIINQVPWVLIPHTVHLRPFANVWSLVKDGLDVDNGDKCEYQQT